MLESALDFSNSNSNKQTGKSGSVLSHPNSNKPTGKSGSVFSNSNSNKQTGKSGSVLSPPNLNKQTLQSRHVEFQPDKKQQEYRTTYTSFHLQVLRKAFSKTQYPDFLTRAKLARKIGKDETRIYYWFQNRRAKMRKKEKDALLKNFWQQQLQDPTYPHHNFKFLISTISQPSE